MVEAFGRLFLVFAGTLICLILAILGLRMAAQGQQFTGFEHPLRQQPSPLHIQIASPPKTDGLIIGLDVRPDQQGVWRIAATGDETATGASVFELIDLFPQSFFYFEIHHPGAPVIHNFFDELLKRPEPKRFLVNSNYHDTLRIARERSVQILTGASVSEVGRMELLANLFLEPLINPAGEIVALDRPNPRLVAELIRRQRLVFIRNATLDVQDRLKSQFPQVGFLTTRDAQ